MDNPRIKKDCLPVVIWRLKREVTAEGAGDHPKAEKLNQKGIQHGQAMIHKHMLTNINARLTSLTSHYKRVIPD